MAGRVQAAPAPSTNESPGAELYPVRVQGLYGYVNPHGRWAIPPRFQAANPFDPTGHAWVLYKNRYGRINAKGQWVLKATLEDVAALTPNGLARATGAKGLSGFINAQGAWVIAPQFMDAASFDERGLARVSVKGTIYTINAFGDFVVPVDYAERAGQLSPFWWQHNGTTRTLLYNEAMLLVVRQTKHGETATNAHGQRLWPL